MTAAHRRTCDDVTRLAALGDARMAGVDLAPAIGRVMSLAQRCAYNAQLAEHARREALVEEALISGAHLRDLAWCVRQGEPSSWRLV